MRKIMSYLACGLASYCSVMDNWEKLLISAYTDGVNKPYALRWLSGIGAELVEDTPTKKVYTYKGVTVNLLLGD